MHERTNIIKNKDNQEKEEEEYGPVEAIDEAVKQRRFAISEAAGSGNDITEMSLLANEDSD